MKILIHIGQRRNGSSSYFTSCGKIDSAFKLSECKHKLECKFPVSSGAGAGVTYLGTGTEVGVKKSDSDHLWSVVVSIALWRNLCRTLEVSRNSTSEQSIMYGICVLCAGVLWTERYVVVQCGSALLKCVNRVARWPVFHRPGRHFTGKLAEAGKRPIFRKSVPEAGILKINNLALFQKELVKFICCC